MCTCMGLVGVWPQLVVDANDVLRELSEGAAGRGGVRGEGEWGRGGEGRGRHWGTGTDLPLSWRRRLTFMESERGKRQSSIAADQRNIIVFLYQ